jgi:hypothetical protein
MNVEQNSKGFRVKTLSLSPVLSSTYAATQVWSNPYGSLQRPAQSWHMGEWWHSEWWDELSLTFFIYYILEIILY